MASRPQRRFFTARSHSKEAPSAPAAAATGLTADSSVSRRPRRSSRRPAPLASTLAQRDTPSAHSSPKPKRRRSRSVTSGHEESSATPTEDTTAAAPTGERGARTRKRTKQSVPATSTEANNLPPAVAAAASAHSVTSVSGTVGTGLSKTDAIFFADGPIGFRAWLTANGSTAKEVYVGYHKVATGRCNMTWSQSVDEALCFGWIDGVRHARDAHTYTQRFTPRRPTSNWSEVNIAKVAHLRREGRMQPAGEAAFAKRRVPPPSQ